MIVESIQLNQDNHKDILHFVHSLLAPIFGTAENGLAQFVRLTRNYRRWRERVEWCSICEAYAPITPHAHEDQTQRHACRYQEHTGKNHPSRCTGSRRSIVWCGADPIPNVTAKAIAVFASQLPNQRSPQ